MILCSVLKSVFLNFEPEQDVNTQGVFTKYIRSNTHHVLGVWLKLVPSDVTIQLNGIPHGSNNSAIGFCLKFIGMHNYTQYLVTM